MDDLILHADIIIPEVNTYLESTWSARDRLEPDKLWEQIIYKKSPYNINLVDILNSIPTLMIPTYIGVTGQIDVNSEGYDFLSRKPYVIRWKYHKNLGATKIDVGAKTIVIWCTLSKNEALYLEDFLIRLYQKLHPNLILNKGTSGISFSTDRDTNGTTVYRVYITLLHKAREHLNNDTMVIEKISKMDKSNQFQILPYKLKRCPEWTQREEEDWASSFKLLSTSLTESNNQTTTQDKFDTVFKDNNNLREWVISQQMYYYRHQLPESRFINLKSLDVFDWTCDEIEMYRENRNTSLAENKLEAPVEYNKSEDHWGRYRKHGLTKDEFIAKRNLRMKNNYAKITEDERNRRTRDQRNNRRKKTYCCAANDEWKLRNASRRAASKECKKCKRCIRGPTYKEGHAITCMRSQKYDFGSSPHNNDCPVSLQRKNK